MLKFLFLDRVCHLNKKLSISNIISLYKNIDDELNNND